MLTCTKKKRYIGLLLFLFYCSAGIVGADVVNTYTILDKPEESFFSTIEPFTFTVYRDLGSSKVNDWKVNGENASQVSDFSIAAFDNGIPISLSYDVGDYDIYGIAIVPYTQNKRTAPYNRVRIAMDDEKYRSAIVPWGDSRTFIDFTGYIAIKEPMTEALHIQFYAQHFLPNTSIGSRYTFQLYGTERQDDLNVSTPEPSVLFIFGTGLLVLGIIAIRQALLAGRNKTSGTQ